MELSNFIEELNLVKEFSKTIIPPKCRYTGIVEMSKSFLVIAYETPKSNRTKYIDLEDYLIWRSKNDKK